MIANMHQPRTQNFEARVRDSFGRQAMMKSLRAEIVELGRRQDRVADAIPGKFYSAARFHACLSYHNPSRFRLRLLSLFPDG